MGKWQKLFGAVSISVMLMACQPQASEPAKPDQAEAKESVVKVPAKTYVGKSLPEITTALEEGKFTSEDLVSAYLERIAEIDEAGPELNSIISLNPDALEAARAIDAKRAAGEDVGVLQGAPILIKDNIETADKMPTTAGSLALAKNFAESDAPTIAQIRANGGIILGKTNLSEWANFRHFGSQSGWSGMVGRTKNPHVLDRQTCGSSAGTGSAIAADLAAGGVGTETNGSIICPSQANGIVGFKPSLGVVSQDGIVPISFSQDTAGPMMRSVEGAAMLLTAMATDGSGIDYTEGLSDTALQGKKIGVMRFSLNEDAELNARFEEALKILEAQGAELIDITEFERDMEDYGEKSTLVLVHEFKTTIDAYLAGTPDSVETRSLADVIAFNDENAEEELSVFGQDIFIAAEETNGVEDEAYKEAFAEVQRVNGPDGIDFLLSEYGVDVLVSPSGPVAPVIVPGKPDKWGKWSGMGSLAAVAGYPHLSVPMGDVNGMPVGLSFLSTKGKDAEILAMGYDFEQASHLRRIPKFLESTPPLPEE